MTFQDTNPISSNSEAILSAPTSTKQKPFTNDPYESAFYQIVDAVKESLSTHEAELGTKLYFSLSLAGEDSQFTRFSRAKIRQTGQVCDGEIRLTLIASKASNDPAASLEYQTASTKLPFAGNFAVDWSLIQPSLNLLRQELRELPSDPYVVLPTPRMPRHTREVNDSQLLATSEVARTLLEPVQDLDFSGLYAGGLSYRAYADSAGSRHWFKTYSFTLDYSLFGSQPNQAVKGTLAGHSWSGQAYDEAIAASKKQLRLLEKPTKAVPRGRYRTYLAPAAVADLLDTIVWGGLGEAALRQGNSAFHRLESGEVTLSEKFSLSEDFQRISIPRFNNSGEIAPLQLPVIQKGRWETSLVNGRSAQEYNKPSNGASAAESMRAPVVAPGNLSENQILAELGTGLYISNLHYLNWSDLTAGRITGMTRYACFWVEAGEIVAPIENLRFDDDLYRFLGEGLLALTQAQTFIPEVGTYDRRSLGGMWMPGMLIDQFRYTL